MDQEPHQRAKDKTTFTNRDLFRTYLGPQKGRVILLGVFIFTNLGLQLLIPQIMRRFIDSVSGGVAISTLVRLGIFFITTALLQQLIAIVTAYYTQNVGWSATNALREDLTRHTLHLDMSFHKSHPPGEMISRIDSDISTLNDFFSQFLLQLLGNFLLVVAILILLFLEDWRIGLVLTGFSGVAMLVLNLFRNIAVPHWEAERKAEADFYSFLEERLAGTADIRANGGRSYTIRQFFGLIQSVFKRSIKAGFMVNIMLNAMFLVFAIGNAVSLGVGGALYLSGIISIGTVYIVYQYNVLLERPLQDISRQLSNVQRSLASLKRVNQLLSIESKIKDVETIAQWSSTGQALGLRFDHVSFSYDDHGELLASAETEAVVNDIVLKDIHFSLAQGETLGLLGRTGSGKTTLTRLLFRLYDPQSGTISISPNASHPSLIDIRQIPLSSLRGSVGMVTQNIELFHASVRDNLTFFDKRIQDSHILEVIQSLGLSHWFHSLKDGLDTVLESGGGGLSAGEAQLLAFTRIFLKDPGVVVLDEASSRLDPATEHLIEKAIDRLIGGRTALIIAHRLKTVQRADKIMILENGEIAEFGDRQALAKDPGSRFSQLMKTGLDEVLV
jgi:ATP-binding cassette subfamily B protein/ATP-binding cassette subfamily C protein